MGFYDESNCFDNKLVELAMFLIYWLNQNQKVIEIEF